MLVIRNFLLLSSVSLLFVGCRSDEACYLKYFYTGEDVVTPDCACPDGYENFQNYCRNKDYVVKSISDSSCICGLKNVIMEYKIPGIDTSFDDTLQSYVSLNLSSGKVISFSTQHVRLNDKVKISSKSRTFYSNTECISPSTYYLTITGKSNENINDIEVFLNVYKNYPTNDQLMTCVYKTK